VSGIRRRRAGGGVNPAGDSLQTVIDPDGNQQNHNFNAQHLPPSQNSRNLP
jgi:hypothetical protein